MTLYGLDLIIDQKGKPWLGEINGICSGMGGFRQVYGDARVEDKVYQMLRERYGQLTVNDGSYQREKFKKEHPLRHHWRKTIRKSPWLWHRLNPAPSVWYSEKALLDWALEKVSDTKLVSFPFEVYHGQDSTVVNIVNDKDIPHPLINPYVAEAIAKNKFLQYLVLKETPLRQVLPPTTLVGLGYVNDKELKKIVTENTLFVEKPLLGDRGRGVVAYNTRDLQKFKCLNGPAANESIFQMFGDIISPSTYFEDLVDRNDFSFEKVMAVLQPFVDSAQEIEGKQCYSSIRAIICNGEFVDAYERYSSEKRVNLSQGAKARAYASDGLAEFCEYITATYERGCATLHPDNFKQQLYSAYLDKGGRRHWKKDMISTISGAVISSMEFTVRR